MVKKIVHHENFSECIQRYSTKSGRLAYRVRVKDSQGRWYKQGSFPCLARAKEYRNQLLVLRDKGEIATPTELRRLIFCEYWMLWLSECRQNVSDGWKSDQERMGREHLLPLWGSMRLAEIKSRDVGRLIGDLDAKGLGSQSRLHIYNLISKLFNDGIHHFEFLTISPVLKKYKPKVIKQERLFLKPNEVERLLEHSRQHYLGPAIWLGCLAGLRSEAIIALQWNRVDLDSNTIVIDRAWKRKTRKIEPYQKNRRVDRLPMVDQLKNYLKSVKKNAGIDDFVAPAKEGGMLDYQKFFKGLKGLCKELGLPAVSTHGLRHSFSEIFINGGATAEELRRLYGHKSSVTTMGYIHQSDFGLAERAKMVSKNLGGLDQVPKPKLRLVN